MSAGQGGRGAGQPPLPTAPLAEGPANFRDLSPRTIRETLSGEQIRKASAWGKRADRQKRIMEEKLKEADRRDEEERARRMRERETIKEKRRLALKQEEDAAKPVTPSSQTDDSGGAGRGDRGAGRGDRGAGRGDRGAGRGDRGASRCWPR
jgi:hypothetical protein